MHFDQVFTPKIGVLVVYFTERLWWNGYILGEHVKNDISSEDEEDETQATALS